jgi:hypothetical protein
MLTEKISNSALLEIDVLRNMIAWMPLEKTLPINFDNAISLIRNFVASGLNVVIPYPLSRENYDYIVGALSEINSKIYVFTLAPKLEKALTNRGSRELDNQEKERIKYHYEIGIHNPSFGEIIDNSEQTPEETVDRIIKLLSH